MQLIQWIAENEDKIRMRFHRPARQWLMDECRKAGVDIGDKRMHDLLHMKLYPRQHEAEAINNATRNRVYKNYLLGLKDVEDWIVR